MTCNRNRAVVAVLVRLIQGYVKAKEVAESPTCARISPGSTRHVDIQHQVTSTLLSLRPFAPTSTTLSTSSDLGHALQRLGGDANGASFVETEQCGEMLTQAPKRESKRQLLRQDEEAQALALQ